jgi:hypothetical protein
MKGVDDIWTDEFNTKIYIFTDNEATLIAGHSIMEELSLKKHRKAVRTFDRWSKRNT